MMIEDFLALDDHPGRLLQPLLERAVTLARLWSERRMPQALDGLRAGLIVDDTGWRNTTAFDLGVRAMGGLCAHAPLTLGGGEAIADLAGYLDNWFDLLIVRTPKLDSLRSLADAAAAPVINARTRTNHPCETLGDLAYAFHRRGTVDGLKIAVVAPDANILGSWAEAAAVLPVEVIQIYPERWWARRYEGSQGFACTTEMAALAGADIMVTDCWPGDAQRDEVESYQVTARHLEALRPGSMFIPCPPVTRGQEVSADAMASPLCCVTEAKAFLLHAQNALLEAIAAASREAPKL
jgi:ornithine carbamoyltransferase